VKTLISVVENNQVLVEELYDFSNSVFTTEENLQILGDLSLQETQQTVLDEVNKIRSGKNLPPYKLHNKLNKSAQDHSEDMAQHNKLNHYGSNGSTWADRCAQAHYEGADLTNIGEDVAAGQTSPKQLLGDFCQSPGHYKPLVSTQYKHIGVGYSCSTHPGYKYFWTIDFGYSAPDDDVVPSAPEPDRNDFNFI
jgi:uncharacterized protein YkwD